MITFVSFIVSSGWKGEKLKYLTLLSFITIVCLVVPPSSYSDEPLVTEITYPSFEDPGPFPGVIVLHTSGGWGSVDHVIPRFTEEGYAVYSPDFFTPFGLTPQTREQTFHKFRKPIEKGLSGVVRAMKEDPKIDNNNIFAVGYSNGGFWVCYLAGTGQINAGVSHFGVWLTNFDGSGLAAHPVEYFSKTSSPVLSLHATNDRVQKYKWASESWGKIKWRGAPLEHHTYSSGGHEWLANLLGGPTDQDAQKRTFEFFKKHTK